MIRICETSYGVIESFSIDADGIVERTRIDVSPLDNVHRAASNMGEPCWHYVDFINGSMNLYEWDQHKTVCGTITFADPVPAKCIIYAAIVDNVPLAFAKRKNNDNLFITSHGEMHIWDHDRPRSAVSPMAIVDRTGNRLYIDENTNNGYISRPIGEHVPFGYWLPNMDCSDATMFAAYGDIVSYNDYESIPIWDVRVGKIAEMQRPDYTWSFRGISTFTNEHLLTASFEIDERGYISTTVFDLRNMDRYDLGIVRHLLSVFNSCAF